MGLSSALKLSGQTTTLPKTWDNALYYITLIPELGGLGEITLIMKPCDSFADLLRNGLPLRLLRALLERRILVAVIQ